MNLTKTWEDCVKRLEGLNLRKDEVYIGHSGGKDSCLVHRLTIDSGYNLPIVHSSKNPGSHNGVHPRTMEFLYDLSTKFPIIFCPLESLS